MKLTAQEYKYLSGGKGIMALLKQTGELDVNKAVRNVKYEKRLEKLQEELIKMQNWVVQNKKRVVVIFEGRDAAGKGGAIRRMVEHLNPREHRVVALPKPNEVEQGQWYFQRYINQLPKAGETVYFDRSWYNRAIVEPVNGFCSEEEYELFMKQVNDFERMLIDSGTYVLKMYFSISKEEQEARFKEIVNNPLKKWKFSEVDKNALQLWDAYTAYKERMFAETSTEIAPWKVFPANKKSKARIKALEYMLEQIPYEVKDSAVLVSEDIEED